MNCNAKSNSHQLLDSSPLSRSRKRHSHRNINDEPLESINDRLNKLENHIISIQKHQEEQDELLRVLAKELISNNESNTYLNIQATSKTNTETDVVTGTSPIASITSNSNKAKVKVNRKLKYHQNNACTPSPIKNINMGTPATDDTPPPVPPHSSVPSRSKYILEEADSNQSPQDVHKTIALLNKIDNEPTISVMKDSFKVIKERLISLREERKFYQNQALMNNEVFMNRLVEVNNIKRNLKLKHTRDSPIPSNCNSPRYKKLRFLLDN